MDLILPIDCSIPRCCSVSLLALFMTLALSSAIPRGGARRHMWKSSPQHVLCRRVLARNYGVGIIRLPHSLPVPHRWFSSFLEDPLCSVPNKD